MIRIIFIFFLLPIFIFSQPNQVDVSGKKQGTWTGEYEDGSLKYKGQFENDIPVGMFTFFYGSGEVLSKIEYLSSSSADVVFYHKNTIKKGKGKYINQKKDGLWQYFDEKGNLSASESFVNGKKEGSSKIFYDNKKLSEEINWVNDQREGKTLEYFQNGNKKSESVYLNNEFEGRSIVYYPNGSFKTMGKYSEGLKNGTWIYYNDDGSEHFRELYNNGKRHSSIPRNGQFETFYPGDTKILKDEISYKKGVKDGVFTEYYNIGEWKYKEQKYDQDKEPGRLPDMVRYFDGAKMKRKGKYQNDLLHGKVMNYDKNGKLELTETYLDGKLVD